jgi:HEAT repeat protein
MEGPQGPLERTAIVADATVHETAALAAARAWTVRLARTLKNCRLYDRANPTVLRMREELAVSLAQLLDDHGPLTLRFTSDDILHGETSLYRARSREDNLGMVFFRDGIRSVAFSPGVEQREVDAVVDALLRVGGRTVEDEDLVTLLWDANLAHVSTESVTTEAPLEADGGEAAGASSGASPMPWPQGGGAGDAGGDAVAARAEAAPGAEPWRSDDWVTDEPLEWCESAVAELERLGPFEMQRLRAECEAEHSGDLLQGMLALVGECLETPGAAEGQDDLGHFLPRLLREALGAGAWPEARRAVLMLAPRPGGEAAVRALLDELGQPDSVITAGVVRRLDGQDAGHVHEFVALARELGPAAVQWLMLILAESGQQHARLPLTRTLADLSRDDPERLAPWLADPRWYVVRNAVHILGRVGGGAVVGLLRTAAGHADARVRQEVLAALAHVGHREARGVLLAILDGAETRVFCSALHQLSAARDPEVARILLERLRDAGFRGRPVEEQRAVFSALARVAGEEVLPGLEAELLENRRLPGEQETHRLAVARCLARIGGPAAVAVLQGGLRSGNRRVRAACENALAGALFRR